MLNNDTATLFHGARTIHMRDVDISLENIGRIFKLVPSSIYLMSEDGVVLLPSAGAYLGEIQMEHRYEVFGDKVQNASSAPTPPQQGNPFSFRARPFASGRPASLQPPPPTTTTTTVTTQRRFTRSISIGIVQGGALKIDDALLYVDFNEQEANVKDMALRVKRDLASEEDIVLCDSQGNKLLEGSGTIGLGFWKQNARRIVAVRESQHQALSRRKKRRTSNVDEETVQRVEELVLAAEELPAIKAALEDLSAFARANKIITVALDQQQVVAVRATFQCLICREVMDNPMVAPCCRSQIGCRACVQQWVQTRGHCPKCRSDEFSANIFEVAGLEEVISILRDTIRN